MRIAVAAGSKTDLYVQLLRAAEPTADVFALDGVTERAGIDYLVAWNVADGALAGLSNVKAIFGLGAGVDRFIARADLPTQVPVVKLADAGMASQMVEYALIGVLTWQRRLSEYSQWQKRSTWQPLAPRTRAATRVGVLGLGAIGGVVARELAALGYRVHGWSRSAKVIEGVTTHAGDSALMTVLAASDVLINLLPTTPATRGLLDGAKLSALPAGAYVVSASRGDQLDADALIRQLDSGKLSGALLDVFAAEPLPANSPLWQHANIRITPHVAAVTVPEEAVAQIVANIRKHEQGEAMTGIVTRELGY